jgi:hypothetical protein
LEKIGLLQYTACEKLRNHGIMVCVVKHSRVRGAVAAGKLPSLCSPQVELADFVSSLSAHLRLLHQHHISFLFSPITMPPPSLQPQRLANSSLCIRSQVVPASRSFHTSPRSLEGNLASKKLKQGRSTLLRREMAAWFAGPGYKFRRQFPGSTNYLSAYNPNGQLRRRQFRKNEEATEIDPKMEELREKQILKAEEEDELDEAERQSRAEGRAADRALRAAQLKRTPKEGPSDLRPFPLNTSFRSEAVLSEEFREELYRQIVLKKMDLQSISAAYGVDMRRVAAVVRLKTVEKQWIEEVSLTIHLSLLPQPRAASMMIII